jgi:hypothetical protein
MSEAPKSNALKYGLPQGQAVDGIMPVQNNISDCFTGDGAK